MRLPSRMYQLADGMVEIIMLSVCAWCLDKSDTVLMRRVSAMLKDVD